MLKFDCFIFKFMLKINLYSDTIFGLYYNVAIGNEIKTDFELWHQKLRDREKSNQIIEI